MPLVFTQPEPAPGKSRFRKALTAQNITRVVWTLLGTVDLYNATMAAVFYHRPASAAIDLFAAAWMFLIAWAPKRATGWITSGLAWAIKGIVYAWKHAAPVAVTAVAVPYARLSDRYGLYGKTLRMRARLRRMRNNLRKR